jgi:multidrug efflux pump subunit AcrB
VFFSLVVARMLTPMMAAYMLKPPKAEHHEPAGCALHGLAWRWCLKHRLVTAGGRCVLRRLLHAGAAAAHRLHPAGRPVADPGHIELPPGSTFARRWPRPSRRAALVQPNPHVKLVYTAVGGGATGVTRSPGRRPRCARPR